MEKNMSMQINGTESIRLNEVFSAILSSIAKFYSNIMEEEISEKKTLHILNVQAAFLASLATAALPFVCAPCVAWFLLALKGCK